MIFWGGPGSGGALLSAHPPPNPLWVLPLPRGQAPARATDLAFISGIGGGGAAVGRRAHQPLIPFPAKVFYFPKVTLTRKPRV
jgi:hypothetical protein